MKTIGYLGRFVASIFATRGSRHPLAVVALVLGGLVLTTAAFNLPGTKPSEDREPGDPTLEELHLRASGLRATLAEIHRIYEAQVAPLARVLLTYRDNQALARRIAVALVKEGRRTGLDPQLLLAVLLVENPWVNPRAVSPMGAVGLMQVMPFHRGKWKGCKPSLEQIESNICHGARIFKYNLRLESGNVDRALLRYNGCVLGTNTPNCHFYPQQVYAEASRAGLVLRKRRVGAL